MEEKKENGKRKEKEKNQLFKKFKVKKNLQKTEVSFPIVRKKIIEYV